MHTPIVSLPELLQSVRHAGYLGLPQAVAELVDNAIQADARHVRISFLAVERGLAVVVQDDGVGMSSEVLGAALRLGGSSRFDDRAGLGRFGMGLPCSSLSQARRVEVTTRRAGGPPLRAHLDLDEVLAGVVEVKVLPGPSDAAVGTTVRWTECDRLEGVSPKRLARTLRAGLGRIFRRFIWDGLVLLVDGEPCPPTDPLFIDERAPLSGARPFCEPLSLTLSTALGEGSVVVRFSELPVAQWQAMSVHEKRRAGITSGAGVSIVRAGREVDSAWLFMGDKKRESYDAWWRCEVEFSPSLDEAFGLTFTKQQVRPSPQVLEALTPVVSPIAYALNQRARAAHHTLAARARSTPTEARAAAVGERLGPLPAFECGANPELIDVLSRAYPELSLPSEGPALRLVEGDLGVGPLLHVARQGQRLVVAWNRSHTFYDSAYAPIATSSEPGAAERGAHLELLLVALARAEAEAPEHSVALSAYRERWGAILAELVRG
jgi:hypothetical protein